MTGSKTLHTILSALALIILAAFAVYWFDPAHVPNNFTGAARVFDVLLFLLVSYIVWHPLVMSVFSWSVVSHIKPEKHQKMFHTKPRRGYKVAFVTTFVPASESIDLLKKTLPAMVRANYKHDTWLLDEGNDPAVKELCEKYGVKHFSRSGIEKYNESHGKYAAKTKGGNHNSWYDVHGHAYDFVAQLDTDFVPNKNFLTKTLAYFEDPTIGFVGTPQVYGNVKNSFIARGAAEQTYSFYGPILRGFDGMDMNMLIGANHVVRVAALADVDHYSAHITEDLLTGMKLHARGWKSAYVPEALAIGEGPSTWQSYLNQQMRWAYGCMHILRNHSFGLFKSMSLRQKTYYFFLQQHYFTGLVMGLGSVGLAAYFFLGLNTADLELAPFLALYIPSLIIAWLMSMSMQQFFVRKREERGILYSGAILSAAAWPIYFIALIGVLRNKHLTYKVTPKGGQKQVNEDSLKLFRIHIVIGLLALAGVVSSVYTGRDSAIMLIWSLLVVFSMLLVPFAQQIVNFILGSFDRTAAFVTQINNHYKIFEFRAPEKALLPKAPTNKEKYLYSSRNAVFLMAFSVLSFTLVTVSMFRFLSSNPLLWILMGYLLLSVAYYIVSFFVNAGTKDFDIKAHKRLVKRWKPEKYPSVDIFLPTAGEDVNVLANTWDGVVSIAGRYKGKVTAYVLDDGDRSEVKKLAREYKFRYEVRPNRGQHKKAGNLRHGFAISKGDFIAIFDADFKPRADFLSELIPYMDRDPRLGIVQTPQYFDVHQGQNWLERAAGSVQELFYRFSQVSRQNHDAAICVGSNALYRREALNDTGGTALIEHSEDVHTGFNLRMHGWSLQYIPVILAKGLCPETMPAFFKQQYRWCMGSMSLLSSRKFWSLDLSIRARFSYLSGFFYYIHTALTSLVTPIIPLTLLIFLPHAIKLEYTFFILPAFIFAWVIYPLWHKNTYGIEAWAARSVYGWAHLFAVFDALTKRAMSWTPTGAVKGRDYRYIMFRILQVAFNFIPAIVWVGMSAWHVLIGSDPAFILMLVSGVLYLAIAVKVTFYTTRPIYLRERLFRSQERSAATSQVG